MQRNHASHSLGPLKEVAIMPATAPVDALNVQGGSSSSFRLFSNANSCMVHAHRANAWRTWSVSTPFTSDGGENERTWITGGVAERSITRAAVSKGTKRHFLFRVPSPPSIAFPVTKSKRTAWAHALSTSAPERDASSSGKREMRLPLMQGSPPLSEKVKSDCRRLPHDKSPVLRARCLASRIRLAVCSNMPQR